MQFGAPDKVPLDPGAGSGATRARWHQEGLPAAVNDTPAINAYAYRLAGGTGDLPFVEEGFPVDDHLKPRFEETVIEERPHSRVVLDWKGNICEVSNEPTAVYLHDGAGFATQRWLKTPVESRADWEELKNRYDPDDTGRLPREVEALCTRLADRTWPVEIGFLSGLFWQLREWLGFERLCTTFCEDPGLIRDMVAFWEDYMARLLENILRHFVPDGIRISEDMAYKEHAMISPAMVREFLLPAWKRWGAIIRGAGCPVYSMDSDGYVGELIPIWIEAGVNVCDPMEVAAGNDLVACRRQFGRDMAFRQGIDKRAIAAGGRVLKDEIERLRPVIESGGYFPGCDHAIPSDVSWRNFVDYVGLLAQASGWKS